MRRVVAVVVEPGLPDRDRLRVRREASRARSTLRSVHLAGLVRMEAERREDALLPLGDRERRAAGVERRSRSSMTRSRPPPRARASAVAALRRGHRDAHACRSRAQAAAGSSTRGKSGAAGSIPSAARVARTRRLPSRAPPAGQARRGSAAPSPAGRARARPRRAQPVGEVVEDRSSSAARASSFASSHGLSLLDVAVQRAHDAPRSRRARR